MNKNWAVLLAALGASACAGMIEQSAMLPPNAPVATMEEVALTGIGWTDRGDFQLAGAQGSFERGAERYQSFDLGSNEGGAGFTLSGGDVEGELAGGCSFSQGDVALGSGVSVTVQPLSYRCSFTRDGQPIAADLELHERGVTRDERRGLLHIGGRTLELRSVHHIEGTPLPTQTPVGYVFLDDRGREVGGVDLNGKTKRVYLPRDPDLREAAVTASVAVAVFWDPQAINLGN